MCVPLKRVSPNPGKHKSDMLKVQGVKRESTRTVAIEFAKLTPAQHQLNVQTAELLMFQTRNQLGRSPAEPQPRQANKIQNQMSPPAGEPDIRKAVDEV